MKIIMQNAECRNKYMSSFSVPLRHSVMVGAVKKLLLFVFIVLTVSQIFLPAALASGNGNFVFDETGILTDAQIKSLNEKAAAILQERECAVYVWIVDLIPDEYAKTMDTLEIYADAFYASNGLGYGSDRNGMMLLLETGDVQGKREYFLNTHGACTSVFSNSVREKLLDDEIVPLFKAAFSNGNFFRVADVYYDLVAARFESGIRNTLLTKLAVVILVPLLIALVLCSIWRSQMKTAKLARTADNYIPANGFNLTDRTDQFLYRTTTRVKIEKSSSGGGSSSSSSGRSSGGRV